MLGHHQRNIAPVVRESEANAVTNGCAWAVGLADGAAGAAGADAGTRASPPVTQPAATRAASHERGRRRGEDEVIGSPAILKRFIK